MQLNFESLTVPFSLRTGLTLSDDELIRFSVENKGYKIERTAKGDITIMSPVGGIGGVHEGYVWGEFYVWNKQSRSGEVISPSGGFNLPDGSCLSPDLAWISFARWNALTLQQQTSFPPLCPDFVIEVRSASDSRRELESKMQLWLSNGAQLAWLVDPLDANVTIYRPDQVPEALDRPEIVAAAAPVAGFQLDCAPLWTAL